MWQLKCGRHFLSENPQGSDLFKLPIYRMIAQHPQVLKAIVHQCMAGLKDFDTKLPIRKATELWASSPKLLEPLRHFVCDGFHTHQHIEGVCSDGELRSHKCRIWPWQLATAIAAGSADLIRDYRTQHGHRKSTTKSTTAFPTTATQANEEDAPEPEPQEEPQR